MPAVSKYMHIKVLVGVIIQGLNVNGHDAVGNCSAQHISKAKCVSVFCEAILGIRKRKYHCGWQRVPWKCSMTAM